MSPPPVTDPEALLRRKQGCRFRRWAFILTLIGLGAAMLGFLVAALGIPSIKASSGHWAITHWFLNFSMRRSVKTHSMPIEVPPMDQVRSMIKAAGHFEIGCAPCHGRPEAPMPRLFQYMTPNPPPLATQIPRWQPEELFYIVKHGVKFTGMPGWPSQHRDDEVWSMVAFLLEFPSLTREDYVRWTNPGVQPDDLGAALPFQATATADDGLLAACATCHGWDGRGRGDSTIPNLAGQKARYLEDALRAYALGQRHSGIMETVAANISPQNQQALARHYSLLPPPAPPDSPLPDEAAVARGENIAMHGLRAQRVPSCVDCHGPGMEPTNEAYPSLSGLSADYIVLQLDLFSKETRGGSDFAQIMHHVAPRLTKAQKRDVASFYASRQNTNSVPNGQVSPAIE